MATMAGGRWPPMRFSFPPTPWDLIRSIINGSRSKWNPLCEQYWPAVFGFYFRLRGLERALELTQGLFERIMQSDLGSIRRDQDSQFRNWLLGAAKHHLTDEKRWIECEKRGGGAPHISIEAIEVEKQRHGPLVDGRTPECAFYRRYACLLLDKALQRLRDEHVTNGNESEAYLFDRLLDYLVGDDTQPYRGIAEELGMTEACVRQRVRRLRKRFAVLFRQDVAMTIGPGEDLDEELRFLRYILTC